MKEFIRSWQEAIHFVKSSKPSAKLVIYSEGASYASYFGPLLKALSAYTNINIYYLSSESSDPLLKEESNHIKFYFIGKGTARTFLLNNLKANVVVMTMPDLDTFYIKRSPDCEKYVYFHHSMVSTHMIYNKGAFDHFDTMLCVGPHHKVEVRQWDMRWGLPAKQLLEHGYSPLDTIRGVTAARGMPERNADGKLNILLAPSWGSDGLMETRAVEVVSVLLDAGHRVHVRPHPRTHQLSSACLVELENKFDDHPNFDLNRDITQFDALLKSHIMISDWSGVAMEFAFGLERPVLFIDVPRKLNNPDYEKIKAVPIEVSYREEVGVILTPERLADVPEALDRLFENADDFQSKIQMYRDQNVYHIDESAKAGADHIYELLPQGHTA